MIPQERKYTKDHEWVLIDGDTATVGITDYAQHSLGDIVFVELPAVGDTIEAGGRLAVVESVKAASDVFSAVAGEVVEVNEALEDAPEKLNEEPWDAFIAKLRIAPQGVEGLLDATAYAALVAEEEAKE
ncbi:MAG TPA: glycine cleavage system protein GcvH [Candidatus Aphodomonas merdavium]|nr:glycine cleavage system protein GcvH [Candidatus Aphodomonas merdavium]